MTTSGVIPTRFAKWHVSLQSNFVNHKIKGDGLSVISFFVPAPAMLDPAITILTSHTYINVCMSEIQCYQNVGKMK